MRVCIGANSLFYPEGAGLNWAYLNWALAFRRLGCEVVWLESAREAEDRELPAAVATLLEMLRPYGIDQLIVDAERPLPEGVGASSLEAAAEVDLLVDLAYMGPEIVGRFPRAALIDIDPGVIQLWWAAGDLDIRGYDSYFTVGEGIARGEALVPDCGVRWHFAPPVVDLEVWRVCPPAPVGAPWTTVTHWWGDWVDFDGDEYDNSKRAAFEPLLELPSRVPFALELALGGLDDQDELEALERHGWRVANSGEVASNLDLHRDYVARSRGEFSAARPFYVKRATGWISDRTICYLAAGRPAVVQATGAPSISDGEGLLTFGDLAQAKETLEKVEAEYEHHCRAARALAEERYAGPVVAARVLADALA